TRFKCDWSSDVCSSDLNCLLGSLPSKRLHVVHFNLVAHLGVEVALAFQPLPDVPFSFLEKVGIDGPFLVNGDQSFKFAFGELREIGRASCREGEYVRVE